MIQYGYKFKLKFSPDELVKIIDFFDFNGANQIIEATYFDCSILTKLTSKRQLNIIEKVSGKTVADHFLGNPKYSNRFSEFDYFEWRLAFGYWIISDQKHRIKEIISKEAIELLKFEFPNELQELECELKLKK